MAEAVQAGKFEQDMGGSPENALKTAVAIAVKAFEQEIIERTARSAEKYSEEMGDSEDEEAQAHAQALGWFASKLRKDLPSLSTGENYTPNEGDNVALTLIGTVSLEDPAVCEHCNVADPPNWMLTTSFGDEYLFAWGESDHYDVVKITTIDHLIVDDDDESGEGEDDEPD
jgi:hypothetical protein